MCFITVHIFEIYIISSSNAIIVYTKTIILVYINFPSPGGKVFFIVYIGKIYKFCLLRVRKKHVQLQHGKDCGSQLTTFTFKA